MRNILILMALISGLIFTSFIKNKTRLLEKELVNLNNEITGLSFSLTEASLDFEYLTTPKNISFLAKNFLEENFSYYKKSLDKNFSYYKESQKKKATEQKKDLVSLEKLKNYNIFRQLGIEKSINDNLSFANKVDDKQLLSTKKINNKIQQVSKKKTVSKKVNQWAGIQVIKALLGIPSIPGMD